MNFGEVDMAVRTNNIYGKITISNKTIARFVSHVAIDSYGIVDFVPKNLLDAAISFLKFGTEVKGVKVHSNGDRVCIEVSVIVKYGVSIKAVIESLTEAIKYKVERFTGMLVDTINVKVMGVQL